MNIKCCYKVSKVRKGSEIYTTRYSNSHNLEYVCVKTHQCLPQGSIDSPQATFGLASSNIRAQERYAILTHTHFISKELI